jgi:hypothetical protein
MTTRVRVLIFVSAILCCWCFRLSAARAEPQPTTSLDRVLSFLADRDFGLAEIKRELATIDAKLASPSAAPAAVTFQLSSGLFGLPAGAQSVDWMVVNDSTTAQTFTITVFKAGVGAKSAIAPGSLTLTLNPGEVTHNANSVGPSGPFMAGFYYEVVVQTSSADLLPSVHVWQDFGNTVISGSLIPPGSWVRL